MDSKALGEKVKNEMILRNLSPDKIAQMINAKQFDPGQQPFCIKTADVVRITEGQIRSDDVRNLLEIGIVFEEHSPSAKEEQDSCEIEFLKMVGFLSVPSQERFNGQVALAS